MHGLMQLMCAVGKRGLVTTSVLTKHANCEWHAVSSDST